MERRRIGEVCAKDIWAFVLKCLGVMLFPVLLLMPFVVVWRIFFYEPEDFWPVVRWCFVYIVVLMVWVWLTSYKTVFDSDDAVLYVIKKRCFLWGIGKKQIPLKEIKQIAFAEVKTVKKEPTKLNKMFRLKFFYNLVYGLGKHLLNKGKTNVCIAYGEPLETLVIDDIKKNDERYKYLKELQGTLKIGNKRWNGKESVS